MVSRILAFRPASVVERLEPRNGACPLSPRDLLGPARALGVVLPVIRAPIAGIARGALVAAKELRSAIGLALPAGVPPEPWFDAVASAADAVAVGLPIFLSAEVRLDGDDDLAVERASHDAWRLVGAGVTHVSVDVAAVAPGRRGAVLAEVARVAVERGLSVDCVVPLEGEPPGIGPSALHEVLVALDAVPDLVSVRCPAPPDEDEGRAQVRRLAEICRAYEGIPVLRRGPVTPALLAALDGAPVAACDDGGAAATRAISVIPWDLVRRAVEGERMRATPLERAAAELSDDGADRLEARAYVEASEFIERLGAAGSALALARALERRLDER